jgi:peptidyl-dipeptidase A
VGLGFHDAGQQQRESYEDSDFNSQLTELWTTLAPLYRQLHAYVRRRLVERYGSERVRSDGPLPAHLLGENMWNSDMVTCNQESIQKSENFLLD